MQVNGSLPTVFEWVKEWYGSLSLNLLVYPTKNNVPEQRAEQTEQNGKKPTEIFVAFCSDLSANLSVAAAFSLLSWEVSSFTTSSTYNDV